MTVKKTSAIVMLVALSAIVFIKSQSIYGSQDSQNTIDNLTAGANSYPTPGEISIVASTPIPPTQQPTREAYTEVADCGFNLMFQATSAKSSEKIMKLISGLDLRIMWSNPGIRQSGCVELLREFKSGPQFAGWQFQDEPRFSTLNELQKNYELVKAALPDKLIYINLIGVNYKQFCGDSPDYVSYLHMMDKKFSPEVWSYDLYPFSEKSGKVSANLELFYSDLEIYAKLSKETRRPFWAYCQSMAFKNKGVERPAATEAYLRFAAFSSLAYGAQGIVYWTYGQRKSTDVETYLSALVNLDGSKTPAWYAARQVNNEIKALNQVFYKSELVDCRHTGDAIYGDAKRLTGAMGPLNRITTTGSSGVIVSHLITGGKNYLVIVSRDPFGAQTVRLNFRSDCDVAEIRPIVGEKGNDVSREKVSGNVRKRLDAGGYAIYQWE